MILKKGKCSHNYLKGLLTNIDNWILMVIIIYKQTATYFKRHFTYVNYSHSFHEKINIFEKGMFFVSLDWTPRTRTR